MRLLEFKIIQVKCLGLPVIVLGDELVEDAMNWNKLLEAADRAGDVLVKEPIQQNDLCAMPFSSGTTGMSKGVMLTHRNLVANLCSTLFGVGPDMMGQVTTLGLIPFFHIYGITGICCATIRNKGRVVVMGRFELKAFLNALITHEVTFAPIVPPIILNLVKNPIVDEFDLSKLKLEAIMTAAAPLAPEILTAFEHKFPGVLVQEVATLTSSFLSDANVTKTFIIYIPGSDYDTCYFPDHDTCHLSSSFYSQLTKIVLLVGFSYCFCRILFGSDL